MARLASILTIGAVNFRSKKELLQRSERERGKARERNAELEETANRLSRRARKVKRRAVGADVRAKVFRSPFGRLSSRRSMRHQKRKLDKAAKATKKRAGAALSGVSDFIDTHAQ